MASAFQRELFESSRPIKRRYVQIPNDQQKLLDGEAAWSENLNRGIHPMLNVPDKVLQDVKNLHIRKQIQPTQPDGHNSSLNVVEIPLDSGIQEPGNDAADDESDGSQVSWPPTPIPDHGRSPVNAKVMARNAAELEISLPSQPQEANSSPPKPRPKRKNPPYFEEAAPSSSALQSDDLEVEPPGFLSQEMGEPVNRTALQAVALGSGKPEPSPPSAQLPIATDQIPTQQPPLKRQRRMEEIRLSDDQPMSTASADAVAHTLQPVLEQPASNEANLTGSLSDPSWDSQHVLREPTGVLEAVSASAPQHEDSSLAATWEGRHQGERKAINIIGESATIRPPTAAQRMAAIESSASLNSSSTTRTPYEMFKAAYPDYDAPKRQFVSACLDVNQLRRDRALPEFLYDDYVRAHMEYIIYVTQCSTRKRPTILMGIEWYNQEVTDAQYTKKVLRRDNLCDILEAHAEDVHAIKQLLGEPESTDPKSDWEESEAESDEEEADMVEEEADMVEEEADMVDEEADMVDEDDNNEIAVDEGAEMVAEEGPTASPSYHVASPGSLFIAKLPDPDDAWLPNPDDDVADTVDVSEELRDDEVLPTEGSPVRPASRPLKSSPVRGQVVLERDPSQGPNILRTPSVQRNVDRGSRESRTSPGSAGFLRPIVSSPGGPPRASQRNSASRAPTHSSNKRFATQVQSILIEDEESEEDQGTLDPPVLPPTTKQAQKETARSAPAPEEEEDEDAFDPPMWPPPKQAAQSRGMPKAQPGKPAMHEGHMFNTPSTAPAGSKLTSSPVQSMDPKQARPRTSSVGPDRSPRSSDVSYVGVARSARRKMETKEERRAGLRALFAKKLATGQLARGTSD